MTTALVKYEPRRFQQLRMSELLANGHHFRRDAGWRCPCGMLRPSHGTLSHDIAPCPRRPD